MLNKYMSGLLAFWKTLDFVSKFFLGVIFIGIFVNIYSNSVYDNSTSWTIGEWLISYSNGFVRRGLPGEFFYLFSKKASLSPVFLIILTSLASYLALFVLIFRFCRKNIKSCVLLSPLVLSAPVIGSYLIRKDVLVAALFGATLLLLEFFLNRKASFLRLFLGINSISVVAILSHESYGFWGLPPLVVIVFLIFRSRINSFNIWTTLFKSTGFFLPSIAAFSFCVLHKGTSGFSLSIHQSWQNLSELFPSQGVLGQDYPVGAVEALGWSKEQGISLSLSVLRDFDGIVYIPLAWLLLILLSMNILIGSIIGVDLRPSRNKFLIILLSQLLFISPLFILGWDFGRWIFLWTISSLLVYGFLDKNDHLIPVDLSILKSNNFTLHFCPGVSLSGNAKLLLILIGIPGCCLTLQNLFLHSGLGYILKIIFRVCQLIER